MAFQSSALPTSMAEADQVQRERPRGDPKVARGGPDDEEDCGPVQGQRVVHKPHTRGGALGEGRLRVTPRDSCL